MSLFDYCLAYCVAHYDDIKNKLNSIPTTLRDLIKSERYKLNLIKFESIQEEYLIKKMSTTPSNFNHHVYIIFLNSMMLLVITKMIY